MNTQPLLVLTALPDAATAEAVARRLVDEERAACVSIGAPVRLLYHCRGKIETAFIRARRSFVTVPLSALLAIFAVTSSAWAAPASQPSDDLLQPEDAFRTTATLVAPNRIEIRYDTAPGYYLYRDRLTYVLEPATAKLGKPNLPAGKVKKDEFFGRQIVYRNKTVVNLPVKSDGATPLTLTADLQGCADLGVCYPPVRRTFTLTPSDR